MTDSAWNFGPQYGPYRPHNAEREFREEENATDAILLLCAAQRVGRAEAILGSMKPGTEAQDATYDAHAMAEDLQAHLIGAAKAISPETYRNWCRLEADKGPGHLFETFWKVGE